ncbi:MAG: Hint domain-containing protein [Paracoccaceae bacterium]
MFHLYPLVGAGADVTSYVKRLQLQTRSLSHHAVDQARSQYQPRLTRNYEIAALRGDGSVATSLKKAVAFPLLDSAFSAFAQGALMKTPDGTVAIEDLQPGDFLNTSVGEPAQIVWIGSTVFTPNTRTKLVRVMADSLGPARPASFVTVGPSARLLQTTPSMRCISSGAPLLTPAADFVDNVNVIEVTPPTPIRLFHVCLTRHAAVNVGGIEMETFHPGLAGARHISHADRDYFLSMFPHISHIVDFGPLAHPHAPESGIQAA